MKNLKRCAGLLVTILMMTFIGGCASGDKLFKAIEKTSNVKSYGFKAKYKINVQNNGQSNAQDQAMAALQNINFDMNGRAIQEKNKYAKMDMDMKYNMMGMNMNFKILSEVKLEKDKEDYKIFLNVPEIAKAQAGEALKGIEYIYIGKETMDKMQKEMNVPVESMPQNNIKEMTGQMTNFQDGLNEFVKDYVAKNGKEMLVDNGQKEVQVNGKNEKVTVYSIKIDDNGLKKFLKAYVNDKDRKEQLEKLLGTILPKDEKGKIDIKKSLSEIEKMPKFIGEKGAVLEFSVKDGYVVKEKIDLDLILESQKIQYNIDMDMFDFDKTMDIKLPVKNEKVIDFYELMQKQMQAAQ